MKTKTLTAGILLLTFNMALADADPPVKMSKTGICHEKGGKYYAQTKSYTPYKSMDACLGAGGRLPKR